MAAAFAAAAAENPPRISETEYFKRADRYEIGNYIALAGLLAGATARLTHDEDVALPLYAASVALRYGGMPVLASGAMGVCRANNDEAACRSHAYELYALSGFAEAALAYSMWGLMRDKWDGRPRSDWKLGVAYGSAFVSVPLYLWSWYRFREVMQRNDQGESRAFLAPMLVPGGAGLAVGYRLGYLP